MTFLSWNYGCSFASRPYQNCVLSDCADTAKVVQTIEQDQRKQQLKEQLVAQTTTKVQVWLACLTVVSIESADAHLCSIVIQQLHSFQYMFGAVAADAC